MLSYLKWLVASILVDGGVPVSRIPQWVENNFADLDQVRSSEKTHRKLVHELGDNPYFTETVFNLAQAYSRSRQQTVAAAADADAGIVPGAGETGGTGDVLDQVPAVCVDATSISVDPNDYRTSNLKNLVRQTGQYYGRLVALVAKLSSCDIDTSLLDQQLEQVLARINTFSGTIPASHFLDEASVLLAGYEAAIGITASIKEKTSSAFKLVDRFIEQTCYRVNQEAGVEVFFLDGKPAVHDFFYSSG